MSTAAEERPRTIEEIRAGIAADRAALGDTVAALSEKFDVGARVREAGRSPVLVYVLGLGAGLAAGALVWLIGRKVRG